MLLATLVHEPPTIITEKDSFSVAEITAVNPFGD
jgi:hypothetical protein